MSADIAALGALVGGEIYHKSPLGLHLIDCVIAENQASLNGGGLRIEVGPVTITNTAIRGNRAPTCSGFSCGEGIVTLDGASSITGNTCTTAGCNGAICVYDLGSVTLNGATVSGNTTPQCLGIVC